MLVGVMVLPVVVVEVTVVGTVAEVVALIARIMIRMVIPKRLVGISLVNLLDLHMLLLLVTRLHLLMLLL